MGGVAAKEGLSAVPALRHAAFKGVDDLADDLDVVGANAVIVPQDLPGTLGPLHFRGGLVL